MKYIVPAILAFFFALVLWQVEKERLKLDYEVIPSATFPTQGKVGKYFIVRLTNDGNASLNQIQFTIAFDSNVIESSQFGDPALVSNPSQTPSSISGLIPLLNPNETVSVTITTSGHGDVNSPTVEARAPGATARPRTASNSNLLEEMSLATIGAALLTAGFAYLISYKTSDVSKWISEAGLPEVSELIKKSEKDLANSLTELQATNKKSDERFLDLKNQFEMTIQRTEQGEPLSQQIIFALMNRAGLAHRFLELAIENPDMSYWQTTLYLLRKFLQDEPNRSRYLSVLQQLIDPGKISPSSRGFALYILAKMQQSIGDTDAAIESLNRCRKETPLMYDHLMEQDPAFDLESLKKNLASK